MLKLATETKLEGKEVIKKAVFFFGPGGYGLEVVEETDAAATFKGGGGGVEVLVKAEGGKTTVNLASQEWDYQTREFLTKLR